MQVVRFHGILSGPCRPLRTVCVFYTNKSRSRAFLTDVSSPSSPSSRHLPIRFTSPLLSAGCIYTRRLCGSLLNRYMTNGSQHFFFSYYQSHYYLYIAKPTLSSPPVSLVLSPLSPLGYNVPRFSAIAISKSRNILWRRGIPGHWSKFFSRSPAFAYLDNENSWPWA